MYNENIEKIDLSGELQICDLKKQYRGQEKGKYALAGINLSFEFGQLVAILGHNGAGKTTLLGSISGSVKPTNGTVIWNNFDLIKSPQHARKITSIMPQIYAPIRGVTPMNALICVGMISGMSKKEASKKAESILTRLELLSVSKSPSENLSGGYRRLVSFGLALMRDTPILLLDEPTNDVDPIRRELVWKTIQEEQQKNRLVLVVTHNLEEISKVSNRYIILDKGLVAYDSQIINREAESIWKLEVELSNRKSIVDIQNYVDKYEVESNIPSSQIISFSGDKESLKLLAVELYQHLEDGYVDSIKLIKQSPLIDIYKRITNVQD